MRGTMLALAIAERVPPGLTRYHGETGGVDASGPVDRAGTAIQAKSAIRGHAVQHLRTASACSAARRLVGTFGVDQAWRVAKRRGATVHFTEGMLTTHDGEAPLRRSRSSRLNRCRWQA